MCQGRDQGWDPGSQGPCNGGLGAWGLKARSPVQGLGAGLGAGDHTPRSGAIWWDLGYTGSGSRPAPCASLIALKDIAINATATLPLLPDTTKYLDLWGAFLSYITCNSIFPNWFGEKVWVIHGKI